jgi:hypothetical protein
VFCFPVCSVVFAEPCGYDATYKSGQGRNQILKILVRWCSPARESISAKGHSHMPRSQSD